MNTELSQCEQCGRDFERETESVLNPEPQALCSLSCAEKDDEETK